MGSEFLGIEHVAFAIPWILEFLGADFPGGRMLPVDASLALVGFELEPRYEFSGFRRVPTFPFRRQSEQRAA